MDILLTIIAFIIVFSIVVLIHEFGHFIAARRGGVKVEELGSDSPPKYGDSTIKALFIR